MSYVQKEQSFVVSRQPDFSLAFQGVRVLIEIW
jgi:hypothetical protein